MVFDSEENALKDMSVYTVENNEFLLRPCLYIPSRDSLPCASIDAWISIECAKCWSTVDRFSGWELPKGTIFAESVMCLE